MPSKFSKLPVSVVDIQAGSVVGPLEGWRHTFGLGGINTLPIPAKVREGIARCRPRLVRIFIQEFFQVYPEHGRFNWSKLDAYMDALDKLGAKIVAALCIKPKPLYPVIDQKIWRPNDVKEWQRVVGELVRRYSVQRKLVTHWEIGNEVDIGEHGGCPYLITDPAEYTEYYRMTIQPILEVFPAAKVGGPANANVRNEPLPGFVRLCRAQGLPLHFLSHHCYSDDPRQHAAFVRDAQAMLEGMSPRPEIMVTECGPGIGDRVSVEDQAFEPYRAGATAGMILDTMEAGLDWSFYYHIWDQTCYSDDFAIFFPAPHVRKIMLWHWNERPHRIGLFGVNQEVRPQYFVYRMLGELGGERVAAAADHQDVRVLAGRAPGRTSAMLVNYSTQAPAGRIVTLRYSQLTPGIKRLTTWRIDDDRRWSQESLELTPYEHREVCTEAQFEAQVYIPAQCVAMVRLEGL